MSHPDVRTLWLQVYRQFIEAVDAVDNGINRFDSESAPRYEQNTCLPSRVGFLNPPWNIKHDNADLDWQFAQAVKLTGGEFEDALRYAADSWLPGRGLVVAALDGATQVHESGAVPRACFVRNSALVCRCFACGAAMCSPCVLLSTTVHISVVHRRC